MNKLPVFRVAGRAIGFTLWNSFTIFRLAWLPIFALFAAQIGLSAYIMHIDGETLRALPSPMTVSLVVERILVFNIADLVLQTIALAAVAVSIHRVILFDDRRPGQYFNFAFGKTEILYVLMGVLTALMVLGVMAAAIAPYVLVASGGDPVGMFNKFSDDPKSAFQAVMGGGGLSMLVALYLVVYIFIIYLSLRLTVWPPAVVATNRLSPSEPWQLTRGNVWRLIGAFVLTLGWIYVIFTLSIAVHAYYYYMSKKNAAPEVPAITAPASPESDAPMPPPPPQEPAGAPPSPAAAPAVPAVPAVPAQSPQPEAPAAPPAPPPAMPSPEAAVPQIAPNSGEIKEVDQDAARRELEAMFGPFAAVIWVVFLFMYIFFTALTVALMSFSYKALKGYEPYEPIPDP